MLFSGVSKALSSSADVGKNRVKVGCQLLLTEKGARQSFPAWWGPLASAPPGACGWHLGRGRSQMASCGDHNAGRYWLLHSWVHLPQLKRWEKWWTVEVFSWFQALFQFGGTSTTVLLEPCKWDWFSLLTLLPYSHPRNRFCFSQARQCPSFQIPWTCSLCWRRCLCWAGGGGSSKSCAHQPVTASCSGTWQHWTNWACGWMASQGTLVASSRKSAISTEASGMCYDSFDTQRVVWIFPKGCKKHKDRSSFGPSDLNMHAINKGKKWCRKFVSWLSCLWEKIEVRRGKYYFKCNIHMPI